MDQRKRLMWRRNRRAEREHRQVALGHPQPPPQQPQPTAPRPHTRWCSAAPKCPRSMVSIALRISIPRVSPLATYSLSLRPLPSSRGRLVLFFTCKPTATPLAPLRRGHGPIRRRHGVDNDETALVWLKAHRLLQLAGGWERSRQVRRSPEDSGTTKTKMTTTPKARSASRLLRLLSRSASRRLALG